MAAHKLILLPSAPSTPPVGIPLLAEKLQAIGLTGAPRGTGDTSFYPTGEHFLQLVTFLGCSPMIELEPPSDPAALASDSAAGKFCHVLLHCTAALQFRSDPGTRAPRCPECGSPLGDWRERIQDWRDDPANDNWRCSHCGESGKLTGLGFGKSAGFGHSFVEIRGIYPSEAVPGEALLNALKFLSGNDWRWIYIKE